MNSFLENKARPLLNLIKGKPVMAVFEINLQCNSQCGYCDLPLNEGRYELSRSQIKSIFTKLYRDGLRYLFIQGGEPTLRKDLPDILYDLHEIGFDLTLITNGTRLKPELLQALIAVKASISISLDTLDRGRYKIIRGADQLNLVLSSIDKLKSYPHPKYITCIVSDVNRHDVLDVVRFSKQHGFMPVVGAYHWDIERYGKIDPELQYQKQAMAEVFQTLLHSKLVPRGYFRDYLQDNVDWLNERPLAACDAGRYSIAIDASGNVAPCLALQHSGNLLEFDLDTLLKQFDHEKINHCSNQSSCNMMCSRVVGSNLKHPVSALLTPMKLKPTQKAL